MKRSLKDYNGGKAGAGTYQAIISQVPKCNVFIDAMAGSLGITSKMSLPALTVINDLDKSTYELSLLPAVVPGVLAYNVHYAELIEWFDSLPDVVFYFDPPYLFETRSSKRKYYLHDWEQEQHNVFLQNVLSMRSNIMISHYPCEFYNQLLLLPGWRHVDFKSMTRAGLRDERIYMNFEKPAVLQDARYVGADYIDRQRLLRKAQRWHSKLSMQPAIDREYILDFLNRADYTGPQINNENEKE